MCVDSKCAIRSQAGAAFRLLVTTQSVPASRTRGILPRDSSRDDQTRSNSKRCQRGVSTPTERYSRRGACVLPTHPPKAWKSGHKSRQCQFSGPPGCAPAKAENLWLDGRLSRLQRVEYRASSEQQAAGGERPGPPASTGGRR